MNFCTVFTWCLNKLFLVNLELGHFDKLLYFLVFRKVETRQEIKPYNSRFIGDIRVFNINNISDFVTYSKDINPNSIHLTAGCLENHKDTFLDVDIRIEEGRFVTDMYHTAHGFDF